MKSNGGSSSTNKNNAVPSSHHRRSPAVHKPEAEENPQTGACVDNRVETGELFSEDDELLRHHHSPKDKQHKSKHQRQPLAMSSKHKRTADNSAMDISRDSFSISSIIAATTASGASAAPPRHARASVSTREKLSTLAVVVHLCKGNIGPGAMSLPNGFSQTGIYAAPVMFVIVVSFHSRLRWWCLRPSTIARSPFVLLLLTLGARVGVQHGPAALLQARGGADHAHVLW